MAASEVVIQRMPRSTTTNSVIMLSQRDFNRTMKSTQTSIQLNQSQQQQQKRKSFRNNNNNNNDKKHQNQETAYFYQNAAMRYGSPENNNNNNNHKKSTTTTRQLRRATASLDNDANEFCQGQHQQQQQQRCPKNVAADISINEIAAPAVALAKETSSCDAAVALNNNNNSDNSQPNNDEDQRDGKQSSSGPMGIFFKVWSLVKVTKVRHQNNKIRRQNSEDVGQFRYVSAEQMTNYNPATTNRSNQLLDNNLSSSAMRQEHFRRAGSQPASSSATGAPDRRLNQITPPPPPPPVVSSSLMVSASSGSAGTTNSSSSGVSSSPSGLQLICGAENSAERKRRISAGQRRATSEDETDASRRPRIMNSNETLSSGGGGGGGIAALQARPATVEFYSSAVSGADGEGGNSKRNKSEKLRKISLIRDKLLTKQRSEEGPAAGETSSSCFMEDENEIYSTPNDSIQSVVVSSGSNRQQQQQQQRELEPMLAPTTTFAVHRVASEPMQQHQQNNMIKSFSTNNFAHLLKQTASRSAKRLIQEVPETIANNIPHLKQQQQQQQQQQASNRLMVANNERQQSNNKHRLKQNNKSSTSSSSTRFFISSSSSSEDSNNPPPVGICPSQTQQIPVQFSVHNHDHFEHHLRPNSLLLSNNNQQSTTLLTTALNTPTVNLLTTPATLLSPIVPQFLSPQSQLDCNHLQQNPSLHPDPRLNLINSNQQRQLYLYGNQSPIIKSNYKKSPSLYEMSQQQKQLLSGKFNCKYPVQQQQQQQQQYWQQQYINKPANRFYANQQIINMHQARQLQLQQAKKCMISNRPLMSTFTRPNLTIANHDNNNTHRIPNSISLHDCKLMLADNDAPEERTSSNNINSKLVSHEECDYKLARMLLKFGSGDPQAARDELGNTGLMQSILSENLPTFKCLIEFGVNVNELNDMSGLTALDLIGLKRPANEINLEMFQLLIENGAEFDTPRSLKFDKDTSSSIINNTGIRLLDRLICEHSEENELDLDNGNDQAIGNKLAYIDCLLHNGAKLGSSTWQAAYGKFEVQLRLLQKLCQDGYYLYKKCSIEAAVFRFEYALKRIAELERQMAASVHEKLKKQHPISSQHDLNNEQLQQIRLCSMAKAAQQVKYQTYLGLSRCERKRKFLKRALKYAHMTILVDSMSYEGFYSKAHILKDLGQFDEALAAVEQTARLVKKSMELIRDELNELQVQEESIVFDGCFNVHDPGKTNWIETQRSELQSNLDYLEEAKAHVTRLEREISDDKSKLMTDINDVNCSKL